MASVKIKTENWKDLSPKRKRDLLAMTIHHGIMRDCARKLKPLVFTAYHGNNKAGWGLYDINKGVTMFYVKIPFRGRGIGKKLLSEIIKVSKKLNQKVIGFPHDFKSHGLFDNPNVEKEAEDYIAGAYAYPSLIGLKYTTHYSSSLTNPKKKWPTRVNYS